MTNRQGFTLIEIIIVISISAVLALVVIIGLSNFLTRQTLTEDTRQLVAALREAQSRAVNRVSGSNWGIHLENAVSDRDSYALFSGSLYANQASSSYFLASTVEFSEPIAGAAKDVVFVKGSGLLNTSATTTILRLSNNTSLTKTITINADGSISF